jgi:hypothetical protein
MTIEEMSAKIDVLEAQRAELFAQIKPLQDKVVTLSEQIELLREQRDAAQLAARLNPNELDIELMLTGDPKSMVLYRERERQLQSVGFTHSSGYWVETGQTAIHICLTKGDAAKTKRQHDAIQFLLPHIKKHEDGFKKFGVFEHTLSAGGSVDLHIYDDKIVVAAGRWTKTEFPTLMEALEYCEKYHWYDGGEEED